MLNAGVPGRGGEYITGEIHRAGKEEKEETLVLVLQVGNDKVWRYLLYVGLEKIWDLNHVL